MNPFAKPTGFRRRLSGLAACAALAAGVLGAGGTAQASVDDYDFSATGASLSTLQAGAHPNVTTSVTFAGEAPFDGAGQAFPHARMRDLTIEFPAGLSGNPEGYPKCDTATFVGAGRLGAPQCPVDSQVGVTYPGLWENFPAGVLPEPLYSLTSPGGDVVARFGTYGVFFQFFIDVSVDPARDYAVTARVVNAANPATAVTGANAEIWGVPTDPSHDSQRMNSVLEPFFCGGACEPRASGLAPTALMTNPTSCGPVALGFASRSYADTLATPSSVPLGSVTDCESLDFSPLVDLTPTTSRAGSSSGLDVGISFDQAGLTNPNLRATAHLKQVVVTLPKGMSVNTSAANGLASCSEAQIGLVSTSPIRFNDVEPTCPKASKVGSLKVTTPVLEEPTEGAVYVADQDDNPFDSLLAGYVVIKGKGVLIKTAGRFDLDPKTGQVVATFDNNPQQPFSNLEMHVNGGERGVLTTPSRCGTYDIEYALTPWSGKAPSTGVSKFTIDQNCDAGSANPDFSAGSSNPVGGADTNFAVRLAREPSSPYLTGISLDLPPGLTGRLAGIPYCPDSTLAAISTALGSGISEIASPACPAGSLVGHVVAGAGSGTRLFIDTGRVYLAGPYKGAPMSLAVVNPAVAGPFDLGNVVVRNALYVNPTTAQISVKSDSIPTVVHGIPIDMRDVRINVDRPHFTINPTNCEPMGVDGTVTREEAASAHVHDRFQVAGCAGLGFEPRLSLRLSGKTKRAGFPALRATYIPKSGDANLKSMALRFPSSEFVEQAHFRSVCTRVQFAAGAGNGADCPPDSVYGHVRVTTPLLDDPLEGPVFLRSSNHNLPDVVFSLRGRINAEVAVRIDSIKGGLRASVENAPDVPISKVLLEMRGGDKGLLVNSRDICRQIYRADARLGAQNGRLARLRPALKNERCGRKAKGSGHGSTAAK